MKRSRLVPCGDDSFQAIDYPGNDESEEVMCVGFGTEVEEGVGNCVGHHHVLENVATLVREGGFLGSCSLLPQARAFQLYEEACRYVWEQPKHDKSHISTRIIPATRGEFGDYHMYHESRRARVFLSPLMSIMWLFEAGKVAAHNQLAPIIEDSISTDEARRLTLRFMAQQKNRRPRNRIDYR